MSTYFVFFQVLSLFRTSSLYSYVVFLYSSWKYHSDSFYRPEVSVYGIYSLFSKVGIPINIIILIKAHEEICKNQN